MLGEGHAILARFALGVEFQISEPEQLNNTRRQKYSGAEPTV